MKELTNVLIQSNGNVFININYTFYFQYSKVIYVRQPFFILLRDDHRVQFINNVEVLLLFYQGVPCTLVTTTTVSGGGSFLLMFIFYFRWNLSLFLFVLPTFIRSCIPKKRTTFIFINPIRRLLRPPHKPIILSRPFPFQLTGYHTKLLFVYFFGTQDYILWKPKAVQPQTRYHPKIIGETYFVINSVLQQTI